jgi:16S rRNA (uracil1498-N3)-methyltransferase
VAEHVASRAWLHVDPLPTSGEATTLDPDEGRHASGARRLAPGDPVTLFDGRGGVAHASLEAGAGRKQVAARVLSLERVPAPTPALRIASALPRGDRQATLLSMITQLGAASWAPLDCARSVARPGRNAAERWQRVAVAACKQSRNAWLPELLTEVSPPGFAAAEARRGACYLLDPSEGARPLATAARAALDDRVDSIAVMVGPEGGFDEEELRACEEAGAMRVSFGETILRTETAGVAALAVLRGLVGAD